MNLSCKFNSQSSPFIGLGGRIYKEEKGGKIQSDGTCDKWRLNGGRF